MRRKTGTPVRSALRDDSELRPVVRDGLAAVPSDHRGCIHEAIRPEFADSLDLDTALEAGHAQENRWDYLLGHGPSRSVVGLEPHSAKEDEISTVIAKRKAALGQLRPHLKPGARVAAWLWVASGKVQFADTERAKRRLDQNGIVFVNTRVLAKHLPQAAVRRRP